MQNMITQFTDLLGLDMSSIDIGSISAYALYVTMINSSTAERFYTVYTRESFLHNLVEICKL